MWSAQSPHIRFPEEGTWPTGKLPPLSLGGLKSQGLNKEMKRNLRKMDESPGQLPLLSSCIDDNREKERERAREREWERGLCVCVFMSQYVTNRGWDTESSRQKTHQVSVSWTARTLQHHQDNRGPHLGDLSQKAAARDLYDQTALTSPCRDRAVQARRFPLILWLALHSPGRPPALHGLPDVYAVPTVYDSTSPVSFVITVGHPSLGTAGIVRGAPDQHFLRGVGAGDALHVGAHHHPAQFLGPSR